jgi:hypothetical protein
VNENKDEGLIGSSLFIEESDDVGDDRLNKGKGERPEYILQTLGMMVSRPGRCWREGSRAALRYF